MCAVMNDLAGVVNKSYIHDSAGVVNESYIHDSAGVVNKSYIHDSAGVVNEGFSHYTSASGREHDTCIELTAYKVGEQFGHKLDTHQESRVNVAEGSIRSTERFPDLETKNQQNRETLGHNSDEDVPGCGGVWLVALGASLCMFFMGMIGPCFGILFSPLLLELGASSATVGWIFSILQCTWQSSGFVVGSLVEEFGWRKVAMVASIITSCSFVLSAFATTALFLFFSLSILGGLSCGTLMNLCFIIIPHYFSRRRGLANGCVITALCLGPIIGSMCIGFLHAEFGYTGGTLIFSAVLLHCCVGASLMRPIQGNGNTSVENDESKAKSSGAETVENKSKCNVLVRVLRNTVTNLSILKSPRAAIIAVGGMLTLNSWLNFISMMPFVMQAAGHSNKAAGLCVTVESTSCLMANIVVSLLSDWPRFNMRACYMTCVAIIAATTFAFSLVDGYWWQVAIMVVWGCGVGGVTSLFNLITLHYMGLENMTSAMGSMLLLIGLGFLITGPSIGAIRDASGSYTISMWVCAGLAAASFTLWAFMPAAVRYDHNKSNNTTTTTTSPATHDYDHNKFSNT